MTRIVASGDINVKFFLFFIFYFFELGAGKVCTWVGRQGTILEN